MVQGKSIFFFEIQEMYRYPLVQSTPSKADVLGAAPTVHLREVSALEGDEVND